MKELNIPKVLFCVHSQWGKDALLHVETGLLAVINAREAPERFTFLNYEKLKVRPEVTMMVMEDFWSFAHNELQDFLSEDWLGLGLDPN